MTSIVVDLYDQARREFPMPIDIEKRMERYHALVKERNGDVSDDGRVSAELTEGTQDRTLGSSPSPDTHTRDLESWVIDHEESIRILVDALEDIARRTDGHDPGETLAAIHGRATLALSQYAQRPAGSASAGQYVCNKCGYVGESAEHLRKGEGPGGAFCGYFAIRVPVDNPEQVVEKREAP